MAARVLVVAGLEPTGKAGLLADVQAIHSCGGRALACASALTAQPAGGEVFVSPASAEALTKQVEACLVDGAPGAVKLGMLARPELASALVERLTRLPVMPVVVDPVLATSTGAALFSGGSRRAAYREVARLRPIFTPNLPELAILTGSEPAKDDASVLRQAEHLLAWGAGAVLVKGGHGAGNVVRDLLLDADGNEEEFDAPRLSTAARGKGCRLASALATFLAQGEPLTRAVDRARAFVRAHLQSVPG
ncbi:MAG: hydroxymethylpyrimidine/phosphomethylpyrimidine kinase [Deltaproteobacteria bacterium]|nr:hydroxymethylpyrimidine/phosphomethylpyrimidine kinase [Deltaproteobacteria bacterium]